MHIMTVCLGNICRSPAAESVLVHKLAEAGLDHVTVSSAGTAGYHIGEPAFDLTVVEGEHRGYVFTTVAQQFVADHFAEADLILAMDDSNVADILSMAKRPEDRAKVVRMGAFAKDTKDGVLDVPDPWGYPRDAFVAMYDQLEEAIDGLVQAIHDGTVDDIVAAHGESR